MRNHKPKKIKDVNILRCILLNVNQHISSYATNYRMEEERFKKLLDALVSNGIIQEIKTEHPFSTGNYCISNILKYQQWSRSDFYRAVTANIVPLLSILSTGIK